MSRRDALLCALFCAISLLAQEPEKPKRPKETEALINRARGLPPEFTADLLLRIAASPLITDKAWKQELIEEAFYAGGRAQFPTPRYGSLNTDSRFGPIALGYHLRLDALSLRTRAVDALLPLNPQRARELFRDVRLPDLPVAACEEIVLKRVDPYYETLTRVFDVAFTPEQRKKEEDTAFVADAIRALHSDIQIRPMMSMIGQAKAQTGVQQHWLNAFGAVLPNVQGGDRTFDSTVWSALIDGARIAQERGLAVSPYLSGTRQYLLGKISATRCSDHVKKPSDAQWIERFNEAVKIEARKGAADVRPILPEESKPGITGGTYEDRPWWKSPQSREILHALQWLNHGNRDLSDDKRFWTLEERKTEEWSTRCMALLKLLEEWKPTDDETVADQYHMKALAYNGLVRLVPPGPLRETELKSLVAFLEQSSAQIENHAEWFVHVNDLLLSKRVAREDMEWLFNAASASSNPVISTYMQVITARASK